MGSFSRVRGFCFKKETLEQDKKTWCFNHTFPWYFYTFIGVSKSFNAFVEFSFADQPDFFHVFLAMLMNVQKYWLCLPQNLIDVLRLE